MKLPKDFEINELREYHGDFWGDVVGYYCKGHMDKAEFLRDLDNEFELSDEYNEIGFETDFECLEPKHCHAVFIALDPEASEDLADNFEYLLEITQLPVFNSFPITYLESIF